MKRIITADMITFNDAMKIIESELTIKETRIEAAAYKRAKMTQLNRRRRLLERKKNENLRNNN
jgi:hypothetical protein